MDNEDKAREQLIEELMKMRGRIAELELQRRSSATR